MAVGQAVPFLETLGAEAAIDLGKSGLVAAALQELSVGLCQGTYLLHRALLGKLAWEACLGSLLGKLAGVVGRGFRSGAD
jgi:hypothetical protein